MFIFNFVHPRFRLFGRNVYRQIIKCSRRTLKANVRAYGSDIIISRIVRLWTIVKRSISNVYTFVLLLFRIATFADFFSPFLIIFKLLGVNLFIISIEQ